MGKDRFNAFEYHDNFGSTTNNPFKTDHTALVRSCCCCCMFKTVKPYKEFKKYAILDIIVAIIQIVFHIFFAILLGWNQAYIFIWLFFLVLAVLAAISLYLMKGHEHYKGFKMVSLVWIIYRSICYVIHLFYITFMAFVFVISIYKEVKYSDNGFNFMTFLFYF